MEFQVGDKVISTTGQYMTIYARKDNGGKDRDWVDKTTHKIEEGEVLTVDKIDGQLISFFERPNIFWPNLNFVLYKDASEVEKEKQDNAEFWENVSE